MAVTAHGVDKEWNLFRVTVDCALFDKLFPKINETEEEKKEDGEITEKIPHTADNLNLAIDEVFKKYENLVEELSFTPIDPVMDDAWTTDSGLCFNSNLCAMYTATIHALKKRKCALHKNIHRFEYSQRYKETSQFSKYKMYGS